MHYLKLPWSHGQPELVKDGFVTAMAFVDAAQGRGDGVLVQYVLFLSPCVVIISDACLPTPAANVVSLALQLLSSPW